MTQFELSRVTIFFPGESPVARIGRAIRTAVAARWAAFAARRTERRAVSALRGLDDHILRDMGVSRSEIRTAVRGELYRR